MSISFFSDSSLEKSLEEIWSREEEIWRAGSFRGMFEDPSNGIYSPGLVFAGRSRDTEEILRGCLFTLRVFCLSIRGRTLSPLPPPPGMKVGGRNEREALETRRQEIIIWLDCFSSYKQRTSRVSERGIKIKMGCLKRLSQNFPLPFIARESAPILCVEDRRGDCGEKNLKNFFVHDWSVFQ